MAMKHACKHWPQLVLSWTTKKWTIHLIWFVCIRQTDCVTHLLVVSDDGRVPGALLFSSLQLSAAHLLQLLGREKMAAFLISFDPLRFSSIHSNSQNIMLISHGLVRLQFNVYSQNIACFCSKKHDSDPNLTQKPDDRGLSPICTPSYSKHILWEMYQQAHYQSTLPYLDIYTKVELLTALHNYNHVCIQLYIITIHSEYSFT